MLAIGRCLLFSVLLAMMSAGQAFAAEPSPFWWQYCFGGSGAETAHAMDLTPDGGFVITGATTSQDGDVGSGTLKQDLLVVKFQSDGTPEWHAVYGDVERDVGYDIAVTSDGGFIVAGATEYQDSPPKVVPGAVPGFLHQNVNDFWVLKLAADGSVEWHQCYGGAGEDVATSIRPTGDGYVVAGFSDSHDGHRSGPLGKIDGWVVKLDLAGGIVWERSIGTIRDDHAFCVRPDSSGGYIVAGRTASDSVMLNEAVGLGNVFLVRLSSDGEIVWQKEFGGIDEDMAFSVIPTSDGGFVAAGKAQSFGGDVQNNHSGSDVWVLKVDAAGNLLWRKTFGGVNDEVAHAIQTTSDGGFIVIGQSDSHQYQGDIQGTHGREDLWLLRLDGDGNQLWQRTMGGRFHDAGYDVRQLPDGTFIAVGMATPSGAVQIAPGHAGEDVWVLKTGP